MRLTDLRAAWSGVTSRGTSFLTAGVVAFVCAVLLGQADLVRVAGLLALLPVVAILVMSSQQLQLALTRSTEPPRGAVGEAVEVRVEVVNRSGRRTPVLLFEDQLPPGLEASTRVACPRCGRWSPPGSATPCARPGAAASRWGRRACSAWSPSGWSSGPGRRPCATSCSSARRSTP